MSDAQPAEPILFLVTGSRGSGKTTFCSRLIDAARAAGWQVAGLLSPPVFEGSGGSSTRTAINAVDLRSGTVRQLAVRSETPTPGSKHWKFDEAVIDWGNQVLAFSTPCDLLVIDELGPLELERGEGWQAGLSAIDSRDYAIALVVIRAEMLGDVLLRWSNANLIEIDTPEDSTYKARVLAERLF